MDKKLLMQAIMKFLAGVVILGALLFGSAGTFDYPQAWFLIAVLFIPMFLFGIFMLVTRPALLRKRLKMNEHQMDQKRVILYSAIVFVAAFLAAGLSYRFHFLILHFSFTMEGALLLLLGYGAILEVHLENEFLSRTVEIQEGQTLIDSGFYAVVRHPMYLGTIIVFLSMPIVLASVISFVIMLLYIPILAMRIKGEERMLAESLEGYREYMERVKFKVIPHIW